MSSKALAEARATAADAQMLVKNALRDLTDATNWAARPRLCGQVAEAISLLVDARINEALAEVAAKIRPLNGA
jgi:hypothetical protein